MTDRRDLAAAYALGALNAQERAGYEAWLAQEASAADKAEAAEFADTAAALALAAEPVQPPASMRSDILSMIGQLPQLSSDETPDAAPAVPQAVPAASGSAGPASPGAAESRASARWSRKPGLILAAAAAAVALFVGGGILGSLLPRDDFAASQASALAELQAAPDAQLAKAEVAGGGTASLVWSLEQRRSAIVFSSLPELPEGETYQLWYIGDEGPIADATFEVASGGTTVRVLDGAMSAGDAVAVTIEPNGGSQKPSSDPIVVIASA